jgi:hypothetical protein
MGVHANKKLLKNVLYGLLIVAAVILFNKYFYDGTQPFRSTIDNRDYKVRLDNNSQLKANLLAFINLKLNILVKALADDPKYKNSEPVQRLIYNWNKGISIKEIGYMESDAAYVINKQDMAFCLQDGPNKRDPTKTTKFSDTNLITYVAIHELAHIMSDETGHGSEFVNNFGLLLDYSQNITYTNPFTNKTETLYTPFKQVTGTSDNFCGVKLQNSM